MVVTVVIDTNAVDRVLDSPDLNGRVVAAVQSEGIKLLYSHITIDEIAEIQDVKQPRRTDLLSWVTAFCSAIPTGGFVLDASRLDMARLGEATGVIPHLQSDKGNHSLDALIGATALFEEAYLLTYDKRLTSRARAHGIDVRTWETVLDEVEDN